MMTENGTSEGMKLAREFAILTREKRDLEKKLAQAKSKIAKLDEPLRNYMAEEGLPKVPIFAPEFDATREAEVALMEKSPLGVTPEQIGEIVDILNSEGLLAESKPKRAVTLFIKGRVWASPVIDDPDRDKANDAEYERACQALEAQGWGEYAQRRFNIVSLSSAINTEVDEGRIKLDDSSSALAFDGTIKVVEKFQVNANMK